jgi:hypothetical protein
MAEVHTDEQPPEDVVAWFYAQIDAMDLQKTDASGIYRTRTGMLRCVVVQAPDATWPKARAEERIKAELEKRRKDAL